LTTSEPSTSTRGRSFEIQDYESWNVTTIDSNAYSSMNGIVFLLPIAIVGAGVLAIVTGAFAFR